MGRNNQWRESFRAGYEQGRQPGESRPQRIFGAAALLFVALACASIAWGNLSGRDAGSAADAEVAVSASGDVQLAVSKTDSLPSARRAYGKLAALLTDYTRRVSADIADEVLFNSRFSFGAAPGRFVRDFETVASLPLRGDNSAQKPAVPPTAALPATAALQSKEARSAQTRTAAFRDSIRAVAAAAKMAATEKPTIFEKLFGKPASTTLAYASPDDGIAIDQGTPGRFDQQTAVYDISGHTVYLPDGTQLEAHSGLGSRLDDPRFTNERMRGPTPATVYDLKLRESMFHGVQALRLVPVDESQGVRPQRPSYSQLHAWFERPVEWLRIVPQLYAVPEGFSEPRDQTSRRGIAPGLTRRARVARLSSAALGKSPRSVNGRAHAYPF